MMLLLLLWMCVVVNVRGEACAWEQFTTTWTSGRKVILSLPVEELLDSWSIQMQFSTQVDLEAWRGEVFKLSDSQYNVTNKCYNGRLYPCQCLELGYLLRYQSGLNPAVNITFNSVVMPVCSSEPDCSGEGSTEDPSATQITTTPAPTTTTTTSQQTTASSSLELHPCVSGSPCHPQAICVPTDDTNYVCECPFGMTHTGEDLNDPNSSATACSGTTTVTVNNTELTSVNDSVKFLEDMFAADPTFTLLLNTFLQDSSSASIEDFIVSLINNSISVLVLSAGVGSDTTAIQAVIDVLGDDTASINIFLNTLSMLGFSTPANRLLSVDRAVSTSALKVYIRFFYDYISLLKFYLDSGDVCTLLQELETYVTSLSSSSVCSELENILKTIQQSLDISKIYRLLLTALHMNEYIRQASMSQLFQAGIFHYIRAIVWLRDLVPCISDSFYINPAEAFLCSENFCCTSPSECSTSQGIATCSCSASNQLYSQDLGCQSQTTALPTNAPAVTTTTPVVTTSDGPTATGMQSTGGPTATGMQFTDVPTATGMQFTDGSTATGMQSTGGPAGIVSSGSSSMMTTSMGETPVSMNSRSSSMMTTSMGETPVSMNSGSSSMMTTSMGETPVMMNSTTPMGETPVLMYTGSSTPKTTSMGETPILMYTGTSGGNMTTSAGETPVFMFSSSSTSGTGSTGEIVVNMGSSSPPQLK